MCRGVLSTCMSVHHMCVIPMESRDVIDSPGTGLIDGFELPCRCWVLWKSGNTLDHWSIFPPP